MNLGELQTAINKAFIEGASKTDEVYLNVVDAGEFCPETASAPAQEVEQFIHDRKRRVVVIKGY